jgi:hypothetical protein
LLEAGAVRVDEIEVARRRFAFSIGGAVGVDGDHEAVASLTQLLLQILDSNGSEGVALGRHFPLGAQRGFFIAETR